MIDFDVIDHWAPQLDAVLAPFVTPLARCKLLDASPRYVEDTRDILFQVVILFLMLTPRESFDRETGENRCRFSTSYFRDS
jgi:hypothetical protein